MLNLRCVQVQYSLLDRRPENGMAAFAAAHNMSLLPYGVVAGGFLSERYLGMSARDVSVNTYSKGKYASVLGQVGGWEWLQQLLQVRGQRGRVCSQQGSVIGPLMLAVCAPEAATAGTPLVVDVLCEASWQFWAA